MRLTDALLRCSAQGQYWLIKADNFDVVLFFKVVFCFFVFCCFFLQGSFNLSFSPCVCALSLIILLFPRACSLAAVFTVVLFYGLCAGVLVIGRSLIFQVVAGKTPLAVNVGPSSVAIEPVTNNRDGGNGRTTRNCTFARQANSAYFDI